MNTTSTSSAAKTNTLAPAVQAVEAMADQAAARTDSAIQSTKRVANEALDSLQSGVEDLRRAAPTVLTRAAGQVEDLTRRGIERARETTHQVKDQVSRASERSVDYIRDEPVKSVLIAAATGAALAALIGWMSRSRSDR